MSKLGKPAGVCAWLLAVLLTLSGCAATLAQSAPQLDSYGRAYPQPLALPQAVANLAATDLRCPPEALEGKPVYALRWEVQGCSRGAVYSYQTCSYASYRTGRSVDPAVRCSPSNQRGWHRLGPVRDAVPRFDKADVAAAQLDAQIEQLEARRAKAENNVPRVLGITGAVVATVFAPLAWVEWDAHRSIDKELHGGAHQRSNDVTGDGVVDRKDEANARDGTWVTAGAAAAGAVLALGSLYMSLRRPGLRRSLDEQLAHLRTTRRGLEPGAMVSPAGAGARLSVHF